MDKLDFIWVDLGSDTKTGCSQKESVTRGWVPLVVVVSDAAADVRQMVWAYLIRG